MEKFTVEQARKLSGISIRVMASKLGLCATTYNRKEKGLSKFYYDEAVKFSAIVGIPIDSIFFTRDVS